MENMNNSEQLTYGVLPTENEVIPEKGVGTQKLSKKQILGVISVITIGLGTIAGIWWYLISHNPIQDTAAQKIESVAKPVDSDQPNSTLDAFNFDQPKLPPGMSNPSVPVNVVSEQPSVSEQDLKDQTLLDNRYKSSIMIEDGGKSISINGEQDATGQKQLPSELQAIMGALGMPSGSTANNKAGGSDTSSNVSSQGGRFGSGGTIAPSANASYIDSRTYKILQGKIIHGTLLTGVKSDIPGQIIAQVSETVYGEQGRVPLIPAGTRLFGEYSSQINYGQVEVPAIWRRAVTPQGVQIMLDSPSANGLGITGIEGGQVNNHFAQTFGTAALLSVIGTSAGTVGVSNSDQYNSMAAIRQSVTNSFSQMAQNKLQNRMNIPPTITIQPGANIIVIVAKDLDFTTLFAE